MKRYNFQTVKEYIQLKRSKTQENQCERMSYEYFLEVAKTDVRAISIKQWQAYFMTEFCTSNIATLLEATDSYGQIYLMRAIPEKKLRNTILFGNATFLAKFVSSLKMLMASNSNLSEEEKRDLLSKIQNVLRAEKVWQKLVSELEIYDWEEVIESILEEKNKLTSELVKKEFYLEGLKLQKPFEEKWQDSFYEEQEEKVLAFYENCSKEQRIEILERIFTPKSEESTVLDLRFQYNARTVLEIRKKEEKITFTEQLYLDYANTQ